MDENYKGERRGGRGREREGEKVHRVALAAAESLNAIHSSMSMESLQALMSAHSAMAMNARFALVAKKAKNALFAQE